MGMMHAAAPDWLCASLPDNAPTAKFALTQWRSGGLVVKNLDLWHFWQIYSLPYTAGRTSEGSLSKAVRHVRAVPYHFMPYDTNFCFV